MTWYNRWCWRPALQTIRRGPRVVSPICGIRSYVCIANACDGVVRCTCNNHMDCFICWGVCSSWGLLGIPGTRISRQETCLMVPGRFYRLGQISKPDTCIIRTSGNPAPLGFKGGRGERTNERRRLNLSLPLSIVAHAAYDAPRKSHYMSHLDVIEHSPYANAWRAGRRYIIL